MAATLTIVNCRAVLPDRVVPGCAIVIEQGRMSAVGPGATKSGEVFDAAGMLAVPGFVDIHVHGAAGHEFNEGAAEAAHAVLRAHARHGTTTLLAAVYTAPRDTMLNALRMLAALAQPEDGAEMAGIYLEGPFLSKKRRGVQPEETIVAPDLALFNDMAEAASGKLRIFALAPEAPGALEVIRAAVSRGVRVSMAHTDATYVQVKAAVADGLSHVSHLFNGMRGIHHREPGAAGAGLLLNELGVELIADGIHVLPEIVNLTIRVKGLERVVLISDALAPTGMPPGRYHVAGQAIEVGDGWARSVEPEMPVSVSTMEQAFRNAAAWTGLPLPQIAGLTSLNPAGVAGLASRKGSLEPGKDADIVLLRDDLSVGTVFLRGRRLE